MRHFIAEAKDSKAMCIDLQGIPGSAEAFELAAKFCYGIEIEITVLNVAMLCCAAHYLQMTEEFCEKNLQHCTELYIKDSVIPSIRNSIIVLHHCENLLPDAEEINLLEIIISSIASNVCKEQQSSGLLKLDRPQLEWWAKFLEVLNLDFFRRVLSAIKAKGPSLADAEGQKNQREMVEVVVSLLPTRSRKSSVPMSFLSGLLKTALIVSASPVCKEDLEKRIGLQLDQAILEDILIPSLQDHRLPEAFSRGVQPCRSERTTAARNRSTSSLLRANQAPKLH